MASPANDARRRHGNGVRKGQEAPLDSPPSTDNSDASTSPSEGEAGLLQHSNNVITDAIRHIFKFYGLYVASQPWEVLLGTYVLVVFILTHCNQLSVQKEAEAEVAVAGCDYSNTSTQLVLSVLCLVALAKMLDRFRKIHNIGSPVLTYVSVAYVVLTGILYSVVLFAVGGPEISIFSGWFLIPLINNPQNAARVAQIVFSTCHSSRISENMSKAMYLHAPTFFIEIAIYVMLSSGLMFISSNTSTCIGVCAWYAFVATLSICAVYFTFFPALMTVMVDININNDRPKWDVKKILNTLTTEETQNHVVQKFKVILSASLFVGNILVLPGLMDKKPLLVSVCEIDGLSSLVLVFLNNLDRIVFISVAVAFTIDYLYKQDVDEARELRRTYLEELRHHCNIEQPVDDSNQDSNSSGVVETDSSDCGVFTNSNKSDSPEPEWPVSSNKVSTASSSRETQTELTVQMMDDGDDSTNDEEADSEEFDDGAAATVRSLEDCKEIVRVSGLKALRDKEVVMLLEQKLVRSHELEAKLNKNFRRAVKVRRKFIEKKTDSDLAGLPSAGYEYHKVFNACCENVVGFVPLPVGAVGPLILDGEEVHVPMATTEGCLLASVNRGCSALKERGVRSVVTDDGMSRGPTVRFPDIVAMADAKRWMEDVGNFKHIKEHFDSQSRFARLKSLKLKAAGRDLYIRFVATTGDAMGMNMLSKGTQAAITWLSQEFPDMQVISLSGNFCTDKKPAAVNWLEGRGKSVVCEASISKAQVQKVLKTTPERLAELNTSKNLTGSAIAGSIGGFNAQAANVVTAIFIATGQDPAQNVCSSNCLTMMEVEKDTGDLRISVTMPSVEVGTVGGGTILTAQSTCLGMMGVDGSNSTSPGANATQLARIVCATVLAGELSLMSALTTGDLVSSHMRHNRSVLNMGALAKQGSCMRGVGAEAEQCGRTGLLKAPCSSLNLASASQSACNNSASP